MTTKPYTPADVTEAVEAMKSEILDLVKDGTFPETVGTFSELHDYVDANCLGGMCDEDYKFNYLWDVPASDGVTFNAMLEFTVEVQDAVHAWLVAGRP